MDKILNSEPIVNCLAQDELLSISVVEINAKQSDDILKYVTETTAGRESISCNSAKPEEVSQTHSLGLSYGKYKVFLEIQSYSSQVTQEQVNQRTSRLAV